MPLSRDQPDRARGRGLAKARPDLATRAPRKHGSVHVAGATPHGCSGVDILGHSVFDEAPGCYHVHLPRIDLLLRGHAEHPGEVVGVAVGVDDGNDRTLTAMLAVERECGGGCLTGDQRIDDDDPGVPLDERDVREVEAAHLIDPGNDLEQAVPRRQLGLTPQARVHGCRRLTLQEVVALTIPHDLARGIRDHEGVTSSEEATLGGDEVTIIVKRKRVQGEGVGVDNGRSRVERFTRGISVTEASTARKGQGPSPRGGLLRRETTHRTGPDCARGPAPRRPPRQRADAR